MRAFLVGLLEGFIEKVQVKCTELSLSYSSHSINVSHDSDATEKLMAGGACVRV